MRLRDVRRIVACTAAACGAACGAPSAGPQPTDLRLAIGPAPAAGLGIQVVSPDMVIAKGGDKMTCWVPDVTFTQDRLIKAFDTFQSENGHHLFGMASVIPRQPGEVFDCTNVEDMSTVQPLVNPTSGNKEGTLNLLPPEFAVRIKAGTQLVVQSHYVNVTDNDILVRDVGNLIFLPSDEQRIEANFLVLNDDSFTIPTGNAPYRHTTECTLTQRLQFAALNGHMHEWGRSTSIERVAADGTTTTLYDEPHWTAALRDAPPIVRFAVDDPLVFEAGDTLRLSCEWQNDTDAPLRFPSEMCVSLMVYFPALPEGFIVCD